MHTKGKWIALYYKNAGFWQIEKPEYPPITIGQIAKETDAKHIVHLHNTHDELVDACKGLIETLDIIEQDEGITACQCLSAAPDDITPPPICDYCKAKQALAKAKGGE